MPTRPAGSHRIGEAKRAGVSNFFQRTLDSLLSHIAILRPDGEILAVNAAWNAFATRNGLIESHCGPGVNYLRICEAASGPCSEQAHLIAAAIRDVGRGRLPGFELEYPCHSPTEDQWFTLRITRFLAGSRGYIVVTHDDVTKRKLAELRLQEANRLLQAQATTDGLTGVSNRRHFDQTLAREWDRHARTGAPLSVLLLDVDHFKKYNDFHGHLAGDDCLREVARTIQGAVARPGDLAARYGGEEFAAILPETDRVGAVAMAGIVSERLRLKRLAHGAPGAGPTLTLTIGCATMVPDLGRPASEILAQADRALYDAKAAGRDRVEHAG
ncbi:diguanylate cyclase [Paludisphaera soli]|uniref:diguanylate cyclase n=1 Tax=Paludisphaera soli TaxID=2712865 RepID=UPI0013EB6D3B|nr:diguanylate cyclase [Paludisphaera soli]